MSRFLRKILQEINAPICRKMYMALQYVHANRPIETIDTLIIGDLCSDKILRNVCQLNHSIKIMKPNRSLKTSMMILAHFTSVLPKGGKVVIIDKGSKSGVSVYDYPFLSQVVKMELGARENTKKTYNPIIFMPLQSIKVLLGFSFFKPKRGKCPDKGIIDLCKRKNYQLIYLSTN